MSFSDGEVELWQPVEPSVPAAFHDSRHIIQTTIEHSLNLWWEEGRLSRCIAFASLECFWAACIIIRNGSARVNAKANFGFSESLSREFVTASLCVCVRESLCVCAHLCV